MNAVVRWFAPVLPEARVAILRTVLYAFVLLDIHLFVRDPIPLSRHPELYSPLLLARMLHLPPPSVPLTVSLCVVLLVGCVVAAANRLPRLAGFVVAAAFTWWTAIGMSYGKVDHDHMSLVVALWVLPTVGVVAVRRPVLVGQGYRSRSSHSRVAKKLSATALSSASPTVPMEATSSEATKRRPKANEVYWQPWSE